VYIRMHACMSVYNDYIDGIAPEVFVKEGCARVCMHVYNDCIAPEIFGVKKECARVCTYACMHACLYVMNI
jgi:hypothetical protein